MERRRLVAKWLIKQRMAGLPRCQRAADAPLIAGFQRFQPETHRQPNLNHPLRYIRIKTMEFQRVIDLTSPNVYNASAVNFPQPYTGAYKNDRLSNTCKPHPRPRRKLRTHRHPTWRPCGLSTRWASAPRPRRAL